LKNKILTVDRSGERLDVFITRDQTDFSRTIIQKSIKMGFITVNGNNEPSRYRVETGDEIFIEQLVISESFQELIPKKIMFDVLYEDEFLIAINKPAGLTVHPGAGNFDHTLVNGLIYKFQELSDINGDFRPGIVHRLDKETSGALVVAKTNQIHRALGKQFEQRLVKKSYIGVNWGIWKSTEGTIEAKIGRQRNDPTKFTVADKGKDAVTKYEVLKQGQFLSTVNYFPATGRTHQIRVHCTYNNHPIFGDEKYGGGINRAKGFLPETSSKLKLLLNNLNRHALHAYELIIRHPVNKEFLKFTAPYPSDLKDLITDPV
jgi:23S rRNA pseudouridine1911/1915/1917 synthase